MNIYQYELSNLVDKGFNTKSLQMESLLNFMSKLGYFYINGLDRVTTTLASDNRKCIRRFTKVTDTVEHSPKFMSFDNCVTLHDRCVVSSLKSDFEILGVPLLPYTFTVDTTTMRSAISQKLVKEVKLQRKKGGQIIVQSNFVKLVNHE
tara:strand:+ start:203 stop:649 length:447 start_codon:yes stop_codon:yes gene_type:complete